MNRRKIFSTLNYIFCMRNSARWWIDKLYRPFLMSNQLSNILLRGKCQKKKCKCKQCARGFVPELHVTPHFFANVMFMAFVGVILKPCKASLADAECVSLSNSTNAMSNRPGTSRTSLKPANLKWNELLLHKKISNESVLWPDWSYVPSFIIFTTIFHISIQ